MLQILFLHLHRARLAVSLCFHTDIRVVSILSSLTEKSNKHYLPKCQTNSLKGFSGMRNLINPCYIKKHLTYLHTHPVKSRNRTLAKQRLTAETLHYTKPSTTKWLQLLVRDARAEMSTSGSQCSSCYQFYLPTKL